MTTKKTAKKATTKKSAPRAETPTEDAPVSQEPGIDAQNASQAPTDAPDATPAETDAGKAKAKAPKPKKERAPKEDLVVFAFRLTPAERDQIHTAAGPAKASKFVRALTRAAAQGDVALVTRIVEAVKSQLAAG